MIDNTTRPSATRDLDQIYVADRWTKYQWHRFVESDERVHEVLTRATMKHRSARTFTREVFARLFADDVEVVEKRRPEDKWAENAHRELGELPEFDRLQRRCRGDRVAAGTATTDLIEALFERLPPPTEHDDPEILRDQVRGLIEFAKRLRADGGNPAEVDALIGDIRHRGQEAVRAAVQYAQDIDASELRSALRAACSAGDSAADELEDQVGAFCGWGSGSGTPETIGSEIKAELARHVQRSDKLQALAKEAGRLRRIAAVKQRSRSDHLREEVVDIELGAELERVLPSELVKLADPLLRLDFARRYFERELLQYELGGKETQGRGPLVVCIDQSSSMEGAKEIWSKGLALALLQIATSQRRWCRLIGFNTRAVSVDDFDPGDIDPLQLIEAVEPFLGGGTNFEAPLREALEAIRFENHLKKADIIIITDGEAELSDDFLVEWTRAKSVHEFTCYAVHVDSPGGVAPARLRTLADVVIGLADVAGDSVAIDAVLSI